MFFFCTSFFFKVLTPRFLNIERSDNFSCVLMRGLTGGGKNRQPRPTGRLWGCRPALLSEVRTLPTENRARPRGQVWSRDAERPAVTTCCCWFSSDLRLHSQRTQTLCLMMTGCTSFLATLITVLSFIRTGEGFIKRFRSALIYQFSPGCAVNLQYKRMKNDIPELLSSFLITNIGSYSFSSVQRLLRTNFPSSLTRWRTGLWWLAGKRHCPVMLTTWDLTRWGNDPAQSHCVVVVVVMNQITPRRLLW